MRIGLACSRMLLALACVAALQVHADEIDVIDARLAAAEELRIQVKAKSSQDTLNFPTMLNAKLSFLAALAGGSESGPTHAQEQLCDDLAARVEEQLRAVEAALAEDLPAFNAAPVGEIEAIAEYP